MSPVFSHGGLRLYLLHLLSERPQHGYELIQNLTDRSGGTYSPSAGTIYPRLAKLEEEGLVEKVADGRKSVYSITTAGRAELAARGDELENVELGLSDSIRDLADTLRGGVAEAMRSLRADLASAARDVRDAPGAEPVAVPEPEHTATAHDRVAEAARSVRESLRDQAARARTEPERDTEADAEAEAEAEAEVAAERAAAALRAAEANAAITAFRSRLRQDIRRSGIDAVALDRLRAQLDAITLR